MALAQIAASTPGNPDKGPTCAVCLLHAALEPTEAAALVAMLSDPRWRYSALSEALAGEGYDIHQGTLARHARGQCAARTKLR